MSPLIIIRCLRCIHLIRWGLLCQWITIIIIIIWRHWWWWIEINRFRCLRWWWNNRWWNLSSWWMITWWTFAIIDRCITLHRWIGFITTHGNWLCWWLSDKNIFILWNSRCISMMTMNDLWSRWFRRWFVVVISSYFCKGIFFNDRWRWTRTHWWCIICRNSFVTKSKMRMEKNRREFLPDVWIKLTTWY